MMWIQLESSKGWASRSWGKWPSRTTIWIFWMTLRGRTLFTRRALMLKWVWSTVCVPGFLNLGQPGPLKVTFGCSRVNLARQRLQGELEVFLSLDHPHIARLLYAPPTHWFDELRVSLIPNSWFSTECMTWSVCFKNREVPHCQGRPFIHYQSLSSWSLKPISTV